MPILELQKRFMQLGNVRLGDKGPRGEPRRRETLRFTTASRPLADAVAELYGGTVEPWTDAPDGDGYWQVGTETKQIEIMLPPVFSDDDGSPTTTYSQFYESWTAAGCAHRCDGVTDALSGSPCSCRALVADGGEEARVCALTTRVSFMIPELPGLGVWLLTTRGYNAAVELPGTLELLVKAAAKGAFIPAVLRLENRVKKQPGEPTKRFVVPVIDLPSMTLKQLASGEVPLVLNAPRQSPPKPPLPPAAALPAVADLGVDAEVIPFGAPPIIDSPDRRADSQADHMKPGADARLSDGGSGDQAPGMGARTPEPTSSRSTLLEEELLTACAELEVDLDGVRKAIAEHAGDDAWLLRQVERVRENLALRQAAELKA